MQLEPGGCMSEGPVMGPLLQLTGAIDEPADPILGASALQLLSSLAKISQYWNYASLFEQQGGAAADHLLTSFAAIEYSSNARGLLADKIVKALTTYVQQGPHYVQTQRWDVAVE